MGPSRQGEVWEIDFAEEMRRPGIIVTRDELNRGRLLLVVPCTAAQVETRARFANHVVLNAGVGGLTQPSVAQVHLLQPVDRSYFLRLLGRLDDEDLGRVLNALAWAVDLYARQ
jgi:mRNA-degrading endonuclease toxin of MazEF toxin-antitoxin module